MIIRAYVCMQLYEDNKIRYQNPCIAIIPNKPASVEPGFCWSIMGNTGECWSIDGVCW